MQWIIITLLLALCSPQALAEDWSCATGDPNLPCGSEPICNHADTYFCEDWEDGDYDGWDWAPTKFYCPPDPVLTNIVCIDAPGYNDGNDPGGVSLRIQIPGPDLNSTAYTNTSGDTMNEHDAQSDSIFMREYTYFTSNYKFYPYSDGQKVSNLHSTREEGNLVWRTMIGAKCHEVLSDGCEETDSREYGYLTIGAEGHYYWYNIADRDTWGASHDCVLRRDEWSLQENEVKCAKVDNDSCTGEDCGHVRVWVNGTLCVEGTELSGDPSNAVNLYTGSGIIQKNVGGGDPCYSNADPDHEMGGDRPVRAVAMLAYYGGATPVLHPDMWLYHDKVVISRERIGPMEGGGGEPKRSGVQGGGFQGGGAN